MGLFFLRSAPNLYSVQHLRSSLMAIPVRSPPEDLPPSLIQPIRELATFRRYCRFLSSHVLQGTRRVAPQEFHPQALTEPYVTVSRHTALTVQVSRLRFETVLPVNKHTWKIVVNGFEPRGGSVRTLFESFVFPPCPGDQSSIKISHRWP